jgi:hypothetical protein
VKTGSIGREVERGAQSPLVLRTALVKLARCEKNLLRQVREPAASGYRPGYELLAEACRSLKAASLLLVHSIDAKSKIPAAKLRSDNERSATLFRKGTATLEGSLRANRPLRVSRGTRAESKIEPSLSRFASRFVVHKPAGLEVRCWSIREWKFVKKEWGVYIGTGDLEGFVDHHRPRANVAPLVCRQLAKFVYRKERPGAGIPLLKMAYSVGVLSHESEHIRNGLRASEAVTECHSMQHMQRLARIMGASKDYADLLARSYWTQIYPLNLPEYRTTACRDGGALDLHPGSNSWPNAS